MMKSGILQWHAQESFPFLLWFFYWALICWAEQPIRVISLTARLRHWFNALSWQKSHRQGATHSNSGWHTVKKKGHRCSLTASSLDDSWLWACCVRARQQRLHSSILNMDSADKASKFSTKLNEVWKCVWCQDLYHSCLYHRGLHCSYHVEESQAKESGLISGG